MNRTADLDAYPGSDIIKDYSGNANDLVDASGSSTVQAIVGTSAVTNCDSSNRITHVTAGGYEKQDTPGGNIPGMAFDGTNAGEFTWVGCIEGNENYFPCWVTWYHDNEAGGPDFKHTEVQYSNDKTNSQFKYILTSRDPAGAIQLSETVGLAHSLFPLGWETGFHAIRCTPVGTTATTVEVFCNNQLVDIRTINEGVLNPQKYGDQARCVTLGSYDLNFKGQEHALWVRALTDGELTGLYNAWLQNAATYVDPDPLCGVTVPAPNEDPVPERFALVWSFEDNNFTWMDASVIDAGELVPSVCMTYGLEPGWQTTWASLLDHGIIWGAEGDTGLDNLMAGTDEWGDGESPTGWDDFYYAGKEQGMFWLSDAGVSEADQVLDKSGLKQYFAERTSMDFDDALGSTSNTYKHVRQLYPLLESPESGAMNTYRFSIGWSANLMDEPDYKPGRTIYLNKSGYSGKHKIDTRSTGRYMAMKWDFTYTDEIAMTGVDIDIEESHGR
jgi:hypothetical protein